MKLLRILEKLYQTNSKESVNLSKSITFSNSLMYLTLCAEAFNKKAVNKTIPKNERILYNTLNKDLTTILKCYLELLKDLFGQHLCQDAGTYYRVRCSDGFDQVIYKPKTEKHVNYNGSGLLVILNAIYTVMSDQTVDMVIKDNNNYKSLVKFLNDLVNEFEMGLDYLAEKTNSNDPNMP